MFDKKRIAWILLLAIKIFFIGLVLQFILHTFVTFQLWRDNIFRKVMRSWKELWIMWAIALIWSRWYNTRTKMREFRDTFPLKKYVIIFGATILIVLIGWLFITKVWLWNTIVSLRYSMTGFALFIIGCILAIIYIKENSIKRELWYTKFIKYLLIWGLVWRRLVYFLPAFIELFWYNQHVYEWQVWMQPPAAYYTDIKEWMVRNQFLFERPIHWWMFLVMFWPLFFIVAIRNKSIQSQLMRGSIYGLNILSTVSRAAWIAWIVQTAILLAISNRQQTKKMIIYWFIPALIALGWFTYRAKDAIIHRSSSNLWHIKYTLTAIQKVWEKPIRWRWPWIAWPASHHRSDVQSYNPENQYLQIWLEYGVLWLGWRLYLYLRLHVIGYRSYRRLEEEKLTKEQRYQSWVIIALSLWLLGLSIEWFFLHSFVDRMIVYPSMLLFGICFGVYYKHFHHDYKNQRELK